MHTPTKTKSKSTIAFYARVVMRLQRHADAMVRNGDMIQIDDASLRLALAFEDLEPRVSEATARLYRSALIHFIQTHPTPSVWDALHILQPEPSEDTDLRHERLEERRAAHLQAPRGPQQKATWVSDTDWRRLLHGLEATDSSWSAPARDWILATLASGLRPCEWRSAQVEEGKLVVQNAKNTNGRAHGKTRTIDLAKLDPSTREVVTAFTVRVHALCDGGFDAMYTGVRNLIRIVGRSVFAGRSRFPTLYTARHCFAARAKSTHTKEGVAALMGHASVQTAGRHYAHAWRARDGRPLEVDPAPQDLEAVRRATAARSFIVSSEQVHDGS